LGSPSPRRDQRHDGQDRRVRTGFPEAIRRALAGAPVAHFDETGFRVAGKLAWVRSAASGKFALITVHAKRGQAGMDAAGVLPAFTGIAVHDCCPYDSYAHVRRALCNAHALRELQAVTPPPPPQAGGQVITFRHDHRGMPIVPSAAFEQMGGHMPGVGTGGGSPI